MPAASCATLARTRSMKKPMLVIAATATVSAIMSTVSRPARRPRRKLRVAKRQALIERIFPCRDERQSTRTARSLESRDSARNAVRPRRKRAALDPAWRQAVEKGATYDDLVRVPEHYVAEMFDGELYASPRPALPHARAAIKLAAKLDDPFDFGTAGRLAFPRRAGDCTSATTCSFPTSPVGAVSVSQRYPTTRT